MCTCKYDWVHSSGGGMSIKVREFVEAAEAELSLDVAAGTQYLDRQIREPALNRPGLALAGFMQYFANKRVQVLGLAELDYLKSLTQEQRSERIEQFFDKSVPAVVVTRNRHVPDEILDSGERHRVPVLKTSMITMTSSMVLRWSWKVCPGRASVFRVPWWT